MIKQMKDDDVERVARAIATLRTAAYADDEIWAEDVDRQRRSIDPTSPFNLAHAALSAMLPRELLREALSALTVAADCLEMEGYCMACGECARAAADKIRAALKEE